MSEDPTPYAAGAVTTPPGWDDAPRPKRNGYRGMLPSTWLQRTVRVEYTDAAGKACSTSGVLADFYPVGPVFVVDGAKTLIGWDRICLLELREETP